MQIIEVTRGLPCERYPMNGIFEFDQAKALAALGNQVIYIALDLRSIRRTRKFGIIHSEIDGVEIFNCNFPLGRVPYFIKEFVAKYYFNKIMKKHLKNSTPDVAHFHFARVYGTLARYAKNKYNLKYFITEHDSQIWLNKQTKKEQKNIIRAYNSSLFNIAVSKDFKDKLESRYGVAFNYVPNIVDLSTMSNANKKSHEGFNFISVGNLVKNKGMDNTILAFAEVEKRYQDIKLRIIGGGCEKENLQQLISDLNLDDKIKLLGVKDRCEIKAFFEESDCFVLASHNETFGVSYIEAMASGLPVIATKCGGPESFVTDKNGIIIEDNNKDLLVEAMEKIIKNIAKYDKEEIRKDCINKFAPDVVAKNIQELIVKHLND